MLWWQKKFIVIFRNCEDEYLQDLKALPWQNILEPYSQNLISNLCKKNSFTINHQIYLDLYKLLKNVYSKFLQQKTEYRKEAINEYYIL